jgi:UDP-N-acetylmuramate--alanine ligase
MRTIAVAGTHGKTTVTGMLAAILKAAGKEPTAIIGSIVRDFGSNFLPGRNDLFVVEACEYRDHLLELAPEILVITNIELDHTDYFPSLMALQSTFREAVRRVPEGGIIVTTSRDPNVTAVLDKAHTEIYDYMVEDVPKLNLIGEFNEMNARAAKCAARAAFPDIPDETIDDALKSFHGAWRRFEYKGETPKGAIVYDDYAHHPTAVAKTIQAARERFPGKRILVAFHPHLHSRTEAFLKEFADALDMADRAIVAPIYEARTESVHTVSNRSLVEASRASGGHVEAMDSFEEIRDALLQENADTLIITMGAGDIYKVAEQIVD